jgi:hypothetical protein
MRGSKRYPVCCLLHCHWRVAGQQIDHHADMRRIEMLDQNERHASAGRERGEQPPEASVWDGCRDCSNHAFPAFDGVPWHRAVGRDLGSGCGGSNSPPPN